MNNRMLVAGAATAAVLSAAGCGSASDEDVSQAARAFYEALGSQDGAAACRLLAPPTSSELEKSQGMPCAQAILEEGLQEATGGDRVEVYGTMAQVRWPQETTILTRYDSGWRVFAAGCAPDPDSPDDAARYDCQVQGG